jgi:tetratricopeptide (TPR) repeat protein
MATDTISTEILINHLRDTLNNPDSKFCFILGSGTSVDSGIDSGATLARQWYSELHKFHPEGKIAKWKVDEKFDENNIPSFYSKLFQLRYEGHPENGIHHITSIIEKGNPGFGYTILSQILQRTSHNVVVTTNFDTLTEDSLLIYTNKRALVCNHENVAHLARPSSTRPLIVKIHRGLYMDPLNGEDDIAEIKTQWKKALSTIFQNYIPIVIGYGGNDDSLMNYLKQIDPCQRMYWCLYNDENPSSDMQEVVEHHKGCFVSTRGFSPLMFRFMNLFGLTQMHDVLEQLAKERSEKLRKEFEEAGKDIGTSGTTEEKQELGKVAQDFDTSDWLQWDLKAQAANNPKEKEDIYLQAIAALPQSHQILNNLACWLVEVERYDDAITAYQKAVEIKPDFYEAWYNMGISYKNKGEDDNAINAYRKAVEIKPDKHEAWNNMGNLYKNKDEHENAIAAYRKAVEIKPDYHEAWYNMGILYEDKGEHENAIAAYRKVVEIKPDKHEAWYNMGISYEGKGKYENATTAYLKAVEIKPDYHEAWNNMGVLYEDKGEYDNAIVAYQKAVEIKPDKYEAWYNMGSSYNDKGEYDNAIASYRKAVEIKPDFYGAWYNMGISYHKKEDTINASKCFEEANKLNPDDQDYKKKVDSFKNK